MSSALLLPRCCCCCAVSVAHASKSLSSWTDDSQTSKSVGVSGKPGAEEEEEDTTLAVKLSSSLLLLSFDMGCWLLRSVFLLFVCEQ